MTKKIVQKKFQFNLLSDFLKIGHISFGYRVLFISIFIYLFMGLSSYTFAQEINTNHSKHSITGNMAFAFIPTAVNPEFNDYILIVPTIGLKYDYHITPKWSIGLHTDFFLQQFEIEEGSNEIARSFPINMQLIVSHEIAKNLIIGGGFGIELEQHSNFATAALGLEYELEIEENWDLVFLATWDYRIQEYSSFILGMGFVRHL